VVPVPPAAEASVTTHVLDVLLATVCGLHQIELSGPLPWVGGSRVTVWVPTPATVTDTAALVDTEAALAVKVALVMPVPMVTEGGTESLASVEPTENEVFANAGPESDTVQKLDPGVVMAIGEQLKLVLSGDCTLNIVVSDVPLLAVSVTLPLEAPAATVTPNVAPLFPGETTTEAGSVTFGLSADSEIVKPLPVAGRFNVREQVLDPPGFTA